jgi:hypothetical protein
MSTKTSRTISFLKLEEKKIFENLFSFLIFINFYNKNGQVFTVSILKFVKTAWPFCKHRLAAVPALVHGIDVTSRHKIISNASYV